MNMNRIFCFCLIALFQMTLLSPDACAQWNIFKGDPNQPQKKYKPGKAFPKGGYQISSSAGTFYLKGFEDNDTVFYIQYPNKRYPDGRRFYFILIDKATRDTIIDRSLNTEKYKMVERSQWTTHLINSTMKYNLEGKNSLWTPSKGVPTMSMTPPSYYGGRFHPLTYKKALQDIQKRNSLSGMEILGAMAILNLMSGKGGGDSNYYCSQCGLPFSSESEKRNHENAVHDF